MIDCLSDHWNKNWAASVTCSRGIIKSPFIMYPAWSSWNSIMPVTKWCIKLKLLIVSREIRTKHLIYLLIIFLIHSPTHHNIFNEWKKNLFVFYNFIKLFFLCVLSAFLFLISGADSVSLRWQLYCVWVSEINLQILDLLQLNLIIQFLTRRGYVSSRLDQMWSLYQITHHITNCWDTLI